MPELPKIYWDASVFLSYINGTAAHLPDIDAYMERSGQQIQIVTSALSIVDVAFAKIEQNAGVLDPSVESKIDALWSAPDSPVTLIEFYPLLGTETRAFIRNAISQGIATPKPADAMHMTTAHHVGAAEIHTYDTAWPKYATMLGVKIGPPNAPNLQYRLDALLVAEAIPSPSPAIPARATPAEEPPPEGGRFRNLEI